MPPKSGHDDPTSLRSAPPSAAASVRPGIVGGAAWRIGRVAGIDVAIDSSWVLIFLLVTVSLGTQLRLAHEEWHWSSTWGTGVVTSLLFFASIVLHELGHSLVAQRVGVRVRSITLFVFGGLAALESEPRRPRDEILIAVAGPLVSTALGIVFLAGAGALGDQPGFREVIGEALAWLGRINLVLAAFNVVPGFPLDGGRVFRGILWATTGSFERATTAAAASGSLFAYGLIAMGVLTVIFGGEILGGLWLVFIGWFLLSAARATAGQVVLERILESVQIGDVIVPVEEARVSRSDTVEYVLADAVLRHGLRTLYVVEGPDELRGLVTLRELSQVPADERAQRRIEEIMLDVDQLALLAPDENGWEALRRMAEWNVNQLPVTKERHLLGAVTRERLLAVVQARLALGEKRAFPGRRKRRGG
jgi:Zn-dependent protease/CBS domain-containing protein